MQPELIQAWTIRTSKDAVRMSVAWAQLINIILATFFAGDSLIQPIILWPKAPYALLWLELNDLKALRSL